MVFPIFIRQSLPAVGGTDKTLGYATKLFNATIILKSPSNYNNLAFAQVDELIDYIKAHPNKPM
ncbi:MAG: hypothetical protein ABSG99_05190 [Sedimentisphaerales bacterium]